jgi:hypothetical protein
MPFEEIEEIVLPKKIKHGVEKPLFKFRLNKGLAKPCLVILFGSEFITKWGIENGDKIRVLKGTGEDHNKVQVIVDLGGKVVVKVTKKPIRKDVLAIQGTAALGNFPTIVDTKILATPATHEYDGKQTYTVTIPDVFLVTSQSEKEPLVESKPEPGLGVVATKSDHVIHPTTPAPVAKPTIVKGLEDLNRIIQVDPSKEKMIAPETKIVEKRSLPPIPPSPAPFKSREVETKEIENKKLIIEADVLSWLKQRKHSGAPMEFQAKVLSMSLGIQANVVPDILQSLMDKQKISTFEARRGTNVVSVTLN